MYSKDFMKDIIGFVSSLENSIKEFKVEANAFKERLEDSWEEIKVLKESVALRDDRIKELERENKALKITAISDRAVLRELLPKLKNLELRETVKGFHITIDTEEEEEKEVVTKPLKKKKETKKHKHPKKDTYEKNRIVNIYA